MIGRLSALVGWLALGHAALAGLFWALVSVPESSVLMLALSGFLVVLMVILAGWISMSGLFPPWASRL